MARTRSPAPSKAWRACLPNKRPPSLPSFRLNLFLQHKRPEYLSAPNAKEWYLWKKPYFRFDIEPHQQVVLEAAIAAVGSAALVAYSCPALEAASKLYDAIEHRTLVEATNFVEASGLKDHKRYTFSAGGTSGWACSDPERIRPLPLLRVLSERVERAIDEPLLVAAHRAAEAMLGAHPSLYDRTERIRQRSVEAADILAPTNVRERVKKFFFVVEACHLLGVSWLAATRAAAPHE